MVDAAIKRIQDDADRRICLVIDQLAKQEQAARMSEPVDYKLDTRYYTLNVPQF